MEGLLIDITWAPNKNWTPLILEGESLLIIHMENRIQAGTTRIRVAKKWRLESRIKTLEAILLTNPAVIFQHVKRQANKLADSIANQGVTIGTDIQLLKLLCH